MVLVRLAVLNTHEFPQNWLGLEIQLKGADLYSISAEGENRTPKEKTEMEEYLLNHDREGEMAYVLALMSLDYRPKVTGENLAVPPREKRKHAERGILVLSDLLAVSNR